MIIFKSVTLNSKINKEYTNQTHLLRIGYVSSMIAAYVYLLRYDFKMRYFNSWSPLQPILRNDWRQPRDQSAAQCTESEPPGWRLQLTSWLSHFLQPTTCCSQRKYGAAMQTSCDVWPILNPTHVWATVSPGFGPDVYPLHGCPGPCREILIWFGEWHPTHATLGLNFTTAGITSISGCLSPSVEYQNHCESSSSRLSENSHEQSLRHRSGKPVITTSGSIWLFVGIPMAQRGAETVYKNREEDSTTVVDGFIFSNFSCFFSPTHGVESERLWWCGCLYAWSAIMAENKGWNKREITSVKDWRIWMPWKALFSYQCGLPS